MRFICSLKLAIKGALSGVALAALSAMAILAACGSSPSGDVRLSETGSSKGSVTTETLPLNNCAGKQEITTKSERSLDISVDGNVGVDVKALEASLSAKYVRGQASSITLPAAAGTNMEYVVEWTEEAFFGQITVDGQSGTAKYEVHVPTPRVNSSVDRGCIAGKYNLDSWAEAPSPITIYVAVDNGSLTIEPSGNATWTLAVRERGEHPSPQPAITCKGRFYSASQRLEGGPGGTAANWTADMSGFARSLWLTFCGWDVGGQTDPFMLYPRELGGGKRELEMRNTLGTLVWRQ